MPAPISIFLNTVKNFYPADFIKFVAGYKKTSPNIKVLQSTDDDLYYGFFKGDTEAQFKYDRDDLSLMTDLTKTQVFQIVNKAQE
jgi:hypothetical protein